MRTRALVLTIAVVLATLVASCASLPSLMAPTASPAESNAESPTAPEVAPAATDATAAQPAIAGTITVTETVPLTKEMQSGAPEGAAPGPDMSVYRDDTAGFEMNYPASWSVVDVAPDIKQQSESYSITFMSWKAQEPGSQGIPQGGSKIDLTVTKSGAASPDAALASRQEELAAEGAGSKITAQESWDLPGGLVGTHLTIQPSSGEPVQELVTAINGNRILVSGMGDANVFKDIATTLRVSEASKAVTETGETPAANATAEAKVAIPMVGTGGSSAGTAAATPTAEAKVEIPMVGTGSSGAAAAAATPEPKVSIPMVGSGGSAAPAETQAAAGTTYTIQKGDTLRKIAERFGVTIAAILKANPQIKNADRIYIGQKITIPAVQTMRVNIYMIGEGGGTVGCGDQVVAVQRDIPKTTAPLTAALNLLLAQKSRNYGESGLYNALYQSNLRIASITSSGTAWTIRLTGTLVLGGVCDNPRVKAQLEQTALQFSTVKSVKYYVNGKLLDTLLSGK